MKMSPTWADRLDTLALVATPALMVSGFIGFLMIGLPQNFFGLLLGVFTGWRRKKPSGSKRGLAGRNRKPGTSHRTLDQPN